MTRGGPKKNMARWYEIDVKPTLFGEFTIERHWGRVGSAPSDNQKHFGFPKKTRPMRWPAGSPPRSGGVAPSGRGPPLTRRVNDRVTECPLPNRSRMRRAWKAVAMPYCWASKHYQIRTRFSGGR
ncbi:WGR domain-containing protein [Asticcacaulis sp. MM231]|uniref:WGR domain-containing protein n=1 Tax=Asticcacaulis sp. MM231 TaxID=3157666 RepID=UPI0032D59EC8